MNGSKNFLQSPKNIRGYFYLPSTKQIGSEKRGTKCFRDNFFESEEASFCRKETFFPQKNFAQDLREESSFVGQRNENAVPRSWEELG